MKIKKGDNVMVIAGKDKGKTGQVTLTFPVRNQVIVDGVNLATKHQKNRRSRSQGQIIEKPMPIDVSNVAITEGNKPVKIGYKVDTTGDNKKKVRISRASGKEI